MKFLSLTYQPVDGGTLAGHMSVELILHAGGQLDLAAKRLTNELFKARERFHMKNPLLRVIIPNHADMEGEQTAEIRDLLATMTSGGWFVSVQTDGTRYTSYMVYVKHHVVALATRQQWLNYAAHEIRYQPSEGDVWEEPTIALSNAQTPCYVDAGLDKDTFNEYIRFTKNASRSWGIILPYKRTFAVNLEVTT